MTGAICVLRKNERIYTGIVVYYWYNMCAFPVKTFLANAKNEKYFVEKCDKKRKKFCMGIEERNL